MRLHDKLCRELYDFLTDTSDAEVFKNIEIIGNDKQVRGEIDVLSVYNDFFDVYEVKSSTHYLNKGRNQLRRNANLVYEILGLNPREMLLMYPNRDRYLQTEMVKWTQTNYLKSSNSISQEGNSKEYSMNLI